VPEGEINSLKLIEGSTFVTSMTVTNNNMLLLCDFSNPRVLVYDVNHKILRYQIDTTYYPWDIAMIPDSTAIAICCHISWGFNVQWLVRKYHFSIWF
jgi:hypothetical protein